MAATPPYKVYRNGEYIASCVYLEDAAALVSFAGNDIRHGHSVKDIIWREGHEEFSAGESYDGAARIMFDRIAERRVAVAARAVKVREVVL